MNECNSLANLTLPTEGFERRTLNNKNMTKKDVKEIAHKFGCQAKYSGKRRTMHIIGPLALHAIDEIKKCHTPFMVVNANYMTQVNP